jgi:hypothetical protein
MKGYQSTIFTSPKIDCETSFFIQEKLIKPAEAAKLANVNYETARKWKAVDKKRSRAQHPYYFEELDSKRSTFWSSCTPTVIELMGQRNLLVRVIPKRFEL